MKVNDIGSQHTDCYKRIPFSYHTCPLPLLWHEFDNWQTACTIFCSVMFHVVCTCTFFGDTICLVTLIDLHRCYIDIWLSTLLLVFNIWASHALEMTINLLPNPWVVLFSLLLAQNFVYPTLFFSVPPERERSSLVG
jgi:hypothetical protein